MSDAQAARSRAGASAQKRSKTHTKAEIKLLQKQVKTKLLENLTPKLLKQRTLESRRRTEGRSCAGPYEEAHRAIVAATASAAKIEAAEAGL